MRPPRPPRSAQPASAPRPAARTQTAARRAPRSPAPFPALFPAHSYAISLLLSGGAYWAVVLMQIVATLRDDWVRDPGGLRLAWMVLTQTGFALQSFAYSKLLWMWLGYSRGVGQFVQPPLAVPRGLSRLVTAFVLLVLFNYGAQVFIAAADYDLGKAERDADREAPAYIAGKGSAAHRAGAAAPRAERAQHVRARARCSACAQTWRCARWASCSTC